MVFLKQEQALEKESSATLEELKAAKIELEKLKEKALEKVNEFGRAGYEKLVTNARSLKLNPYGRSDGLLSSLFSRLSSKQNSNIELLELWGIPEVVDYDRASRLALAQVQRIVSEIASPHHSLFRLNLSGKDPTLVVVQKVVKVPPKVMLLTQLRAELRGMADENLIYMKERFVYPGERSFITHCIQGFPATMLLPPRDFLNFAAWDEDLENKDVLWFASQSLKNNNILGFTSGCERGILKISGLKLEPVELEHKDDSGNSTGTNVTMVYSVDPRIWMPRPRFNAQISSMLEDYIDGCELVGLELMDENKHTKMIEGYINHPVPSKKANIAGVTKDITKDMPVVVSDIETKPKVAGAHEENADQDSDDGKSGKKKKKKSKKGKKVTISDEVTEIEPEDRHSKRKHKRHKKKSRSSKSGKRSRKYALVDSSDSESDSSDSYSSDDSDLSFDEKYVWERVESSDSDDDSIGLDEELDDMLENYSMYEGRALDSHRYRKY